MTTDAQAALAAAALVMASRPSGLDSHYDAEQTTLIMADGFLRWLKRRAGTIERHADERLVPNEDFKSPSAARTERIDPRAVLNAAGPTMPLRTVSGHYTGPHVNGGPACVTPSGANACLCGEKWPCSQSLAGRP